VTTYTPWDFERFARLPIAVYLALGRGEITVWQFFILVYWHMKADRGTGVVLSFRAEIILDWLADMDCSPFDAKRLPSLRTIQRHARGLHEAGWCLSGYIPGKKTPYDVTLCNFVPAKAQNDDASVYFGRGADKNLFSDAEKNGIGVADRVLLNPSKIRHWKETSLSHVADKNGICVADESAFSDAEMSLNTKKAGIAFGGGQENRPPVTCAEVEAVDSEKAGRLLRNALAKVSSEILHNTRLAPKNLGFKFELLAATYGHEAVTQDYENWCREHLADRPKYPITDYVRVIDSRLGSVPEEESIPLTDPRIAELAAFAFETTGKLAPKIAIARLLMKYPVEEIQAAMVELMESLTADNEIKGALRAFYNDGGADAIIATRRKRVTKGRCVGANS
jgi:hypothetical protein